MSQKKNRRKRKVVRAYYEIALAAWEANRPPRWRFIKYRKWKKIKPKMPRVGRDMGARK